MTLLIMHYNNEEGGHCSSKAVIKSKNQMAHQREPFDWKWAESSAEESPTFVSSLLVMYFVWFLNSEKEDFLFFLM